MFLKMNGSLYKIEPTYNKGSEKFRYTKKIIKNRKNDMLNNKVSQHKKNTNIMDTPQKQIKNCTIATIIDFYNYEALKHCYNLIQLDAANWRKALVEVKPDLLLVESVWKNNNTGWKDKISNIKKDKRKALVKLIAFCKTNNIPTVFLNTVDHAHFEGFSKAAKYFDYIFTTDINTIDKYKKLVSHNHVYHFPYITQNKNMKEVTIENEAFLNILNKNRDIKEKNRMHMHDKEYQDRLSLLAQRKALRNNNYLYGIEKILTTVGIKYNSFKEAGVSIITATNRQDFFDNIFQNFERQRYKIKELIIVLNNNKINTEEWNKRAQLYHNVKILQLDENQPLGACLNLGISKSKYDYISKFDDDDYYGAEYIGDLMDCFKYTDAHIVGKRSFYIYFEESKTLAINTLNRQHCYTNFIAGSTITAKKEIFKKIKFATDRESGSDTQFRKDCIANNYKIYAADRFNYVACRRPDLKNHTWKITDNEWLKSCKIIGKTSKYKNYATV